MMIVFSALVFIGVGVWWMESRFGSTFAIAVVGSLLGAVLVIVGNLLGLANSRSTLDAAARFNESLAMTEKHRQMTYKEQAKGDSAMQRAHAQLTVMDARRVDQLAQQRANLLVDNNKQQSAQRWNDKDTGEYRTWD